MGKFLIKKTATGVKFDLLAGNGQVIHAPSPGKKVCYIALSKICSYSTYVGARRVY